MEVTPKVEFLGLTFDLTVIIGSLLSSVIVLLIVILATRGRKMVPTGMQNLVEMIIDFARGLSRMGYSDNKTAERFLGFTFTLFLFIFISNQLGVIMMVSAEATGPIPAWGIEKGESIAFLKSPTADLSVTVAMAVAIALFANFMGMGKNFKGYVKHFAGPMLPLHLIEEITKPATHAMRIWANIFAGEVLITIMLNEFPIWLTGAPLLVWIGFSLFVGAIQAYIFTVLANVYIGQKINTEHH